jgi:hypothetical protein
VFIPKANARRRAVGARGPHCCRRSALESATRRSGNTVGRGHSARDRKPWNALSAFSGELAPQSGPRDAPAPHPAAHCKYMCSSVLSHATKAGHVRTEGRATVAGKDRPLQVIGRSKAASS